MAGALPDILTPHLSLEARFTSWSHGLPAWLTFTALLFLAAVIRRDVLNLPLAVAMSLAYLFHLACDAISGGINWLYPIKDHFIGGYLVDPVFWTPIDVVLLLATYYLFRIQGKIRSP